ncbi:MAG: hypothetical protein LBP86_02605, partial [Azoarcus sp.]|nr:hypothetical protein [Azoarcus sp.]
RLYLQGNDDILPLPLQKMITKTISLFYLINVLRIVQDRLSNICVHSIDKKIDFFLLHAVRPFLGMLPPRTRNAPM